MIYKIEVYNRGSFLDSVDSEGDNSLIAINKVEDFFVKKYKTLFLCFQARQKPNLTKFIKETTRERIYQ